MSGKNATRKILKAAVDEIGTPFYIYDQGKIIENIRKVKNAFAEIPIHYSLKSNPCPALCKIISEAGIEAEIASPFEARVAVEAGFDPAEILYDGPGKTEENISEVLSLGIRRFNIESVTELARLKKITPENSEHLSLCFRVNPLEASSAAEKMTGKPSRFGIDIEELPQALDAAAGDGFNINGIHLYLGSQILSDGQLTANYRTGLEIIDKYCEKFYHRGKIEYIFGAGFGIPYLDDESGINPAYLAESFAKLRKQYSFPAEIKTRFELGRYLVGNAGYYLAKIIDIKVSRREKFITLDGGINHFLRYVLTRTRHGISSLNSISGDLETVQVCGRTCTPYDLLSSCDMPENLSIGDILVLEDAGAYGWSMGMQNFLSFPSCPELILDGNNFHIVRRKSTFEDFSALNIN